MAETTISAAQTGGMLGNNLAAMLRQLGLLLGIAASVALGVAVVMWSQTPNYELLYGSMTDKDVIQVQDALKGENIPYKVDEKTGAVMVAASRLAEARMKLAAAGLPRSASIGYELLDEKQGFGTSQFIEKARYQRALEGELARSIAELNPVRSARVHLAIPKQSVFIRNARKPSASVLVDVYPGRQLDPGQVAAITHLVSASIPNLMTSQVTVVDQHGSLLSGRGDNNEMAQTGWRFDYTRKLEQSYSKRIEDILVPFLGQNGVRAQVTAKLDFSSTEQASETYNPDSPALRSEQLLEETRDTGKAGGIPGALSNQPPGAVTVPETTKAGAKPGATGTQPATGTKGTRRKRSTKNFELDKTISHSRMPMGSIRRLSVAVVVDNIRQTGADGKLTHRQRTPEELARISNLVKEAVGFDAARGDTVNVISNDFTVPPAAEALPEPPIWKQAWVWDIAKQVGGVIFALILAFGILRPFMRAMLKKPPAMVAAEGPALDGPGGQPALPPGATGMAGQTAQLEGPGTAAGGGMQPSQAAMMMSSPSGYEADLKQVTDFVQSEPKLAAQVVKDWVEE